MTTSLMAISRHALVFGLGEQADASWGKIHGDVDVTYVEKMLKQSGYADITTLVNEQATKSSMIRAFEQLALRCQVGDMVYIHYSGHGQLITDVDGDEALRQKGSMAQWEQAWIPYDAYMSYCDQDRGEKHLTDDELAILLTSIRKKIGPRGQILVVIDACHSGDSTRENGEEIECVRGTDRKFVIPFTEEPPSGRTVSEQWLTISACQSYQVGGEMKQPQVGKLTYALYSLRGQFRNKSNAELAQYLAEWIQNNPSRFPQTPAMTGDSIVNQIKYILR